MTGPSISGIVTSNLGHAVVVPKDSPLQSLKDLKNRTNPAVIGLVTGSSAEFYFQSAMEVYGLQMGKHVVLKNMSQAEQALLPRGVDAVVPWEPIPSLLTEVRKTGRIIDWIFPYNFYEGNFYVRKELVDFVPDVVQAIADAFVEAHLWIRRYPEKAVEALTKEPNLRAFDRQLLEQQVKLYNLLYKPTVAFVHEEFWARENERIAQWLKKNNRLQREVTYETYLNAFEPSFITKTFEKLGWKVPDKPVFLPKDWRGEVGSLPYPVYFNVATLKEPQAFPEAGDLIRPWQFGGKVYKP